MIQFDFSELASFSEGGKRLRDMLEDAAGAAARAIEWLRCGGGMTGWVDLPLRRREAGEIRCYAEVVRREFSHAVVLGIGGSSLGPKALYSAAYHPMPLLEKWNPPGMKLLFLDNSDPDTVGAVLDSLDLRKTLFVVITKSGSTAETMSQLMLAWAQMNLVVGKEAPRHFVFVTDPVKGDLRALARELGVRAFDVPEDVGGRYSVLSAVGLLPVALAGIDPAGLLAMAERVREGCLVPDLFANPAALLGTAAFLLDKEFGKTVHVFFVYSDRLAETAVWFRQLWAESLGKRKGGIGVGPTPLDARGATDQHSLLQLLRDGPRDKLVIFVGTGKRRCLGIPSVFGNYPSCSYLAGRGMDELIESEEAGTRRSLFLAGVPIIGIRLDEVSAASVAAMMYLLEVAAAVAGFHYEVNPFDQPGVEESKRFTEAIMGRPGLEALRAEIASEAVPSLGQWVLEI